MVVMIQLPAKIQMKFKLGEKTMKKLFALSMLIMSQHVIAATLTVKSNTSIQDVVKQAKDGDTILVEPWLVSSVCLYRPAEYYHSRING